MITLGYSQDLLDPTINQVDDQGHKQGNWRTVDEAGNLKFEGAFINDIPVGTFTFYYPDGKIRAVSVMFDNGKRSRTKLFHPNGRLMGEGNYLNKVKDSTWNYYSDFDGVRLSSEYYIEGALDGNVVNYYPQGDVAEEIPYKMGLKDGVWKQYFTDGKLKLKATYINDMLEGMMFVYYQNGVPEVSGIYKNNFKDGPWLYFTDKGVAYKKETFLKGSLKKTETF